MDYLDLDQPNPKHLRVIKTARNEKDINEAVRQGFRPIVKLLKASRKIRSKFCVYQNRKTGEILEVGDYRVAISFEHQSEYELVVPWTYHYPYHFESPYAAYLIPSDIQKGERVFIEDLIEDFIGQHWNQGDTYRLECCEAIWNGTKLVIQFNPNRDTSHLIG